MPTKSDTIRPDVDKEIKSPFFLLSTKCKALMTALKAFQHPSSFVILSFDETHVLGDNYPSFRRALRALTSQPVFSLFLSTAGNMSNSIPNQTRRADPSARMFKRERVIPPFAELGFDHFAKRTNLPGSQDPMETDDMLTHVSSTYCQLVKFGRPLCVYVPYRPFISNNSSARWATRYDEGDPNVRADIIGFAASKLLGGINPWGGRQYASRAFIVSSPGTLGSHRCIWRRSR